MTDKEKIRAEVESRLKRLTDGCVGQRYAYRTLLEFIDSLYEEPVSEDLEEAAWMYYDKNKPMLPQEFALHRVFVDFFKAGAKWQKEQMMKDAIDTVMVYDDLNDLVPGIEDLSINGYTVGDKVKVIIIKDE